VPTSTPPAITTNSSGSTLPVAQPVLAPQPTSASSSPTNIIGPYLSLSRCFTGCPIVDIKVISGAPDVEPPAGYRKTRGILAWL
jgi:hypothetical protein